MEQIDLNGFVANVYRVAETGNVCVILIARGSAPIDSAITVLMSRDQALALAQAIARTVPEQASPAI